MDLEIRLNLFPSSAPQSLTGDAPHPECPIDLRFVPHVHLDLLYKIASEGP